MHQIEIENKKRTRMAICNGEPSGVAGARGRKWPWLHDAMNTVARARADRSDATAFMLMQAQTMRVGQRRFELSLQIAQWEKPEARH
jgi:hypothetical protein